MVGSYYVINTYVEREMGLETTEVYINKRRDNGNNNTCVYCVCTRVISIYDVRSDFSLRVCNENINVFVKLIINRTRLNRWLVLITRF